ncbi:DUF3613 domain-containing protein [Imbroritus primus]|uniref:DUF3613 domain-containing protein n=1 Tax=Imbroritus primus TaxID=3058603 RepID=A0ACD3SN19_9BURK|nr:DUF3613 domain-containing protein [Burkholderiaceae bacterium PBA]
MAYLSYPSFLRRQACSILLAGLATLCVPVAAWAEQALTPPVGETTRAALAVQRNGTQAGQPVQVSGEQAALSRKRYLDSFSHPIPPTFQSTAAGAGGMPNSSQGNARR